jgi:molybdate transport system substrate-binding protein
MFPQACDPRRESPLQEHMTTRLTGISSMATRLLLNELMAMYERRSGISVTIESVGGVDAAKRVQAGEPFDLVVLASDAIDKLIAAERVVAGSKVDVARSGVAVAVRAGAQHPAIDSGNALREAVRAARTVGYSTGPSGVQLAKLFESWGIAGEIKDRIVQATPGIPVGSLVAKGEVELGFQQLSELLHVEGVDILGPLPPEVQITTVFSAGTCAGSKNFDAVREVLKFMTSPEADEAKRKQGMEAA